MQIAPLWISFLYPNPFHDFRQNEVAVLDKDYGEQVTYLWMCKEPLDADIAEITNGRFLPEFIEERIVDVEV